MSDLQAGQVGAAGRSAAAQISVGHDANTASGEPTKGRGTGRFGRGTGILVATVLGSSLAFIDASVVNVALPEIGRALGADATGLQWVINAYLLPMSALVLIGGAAGDHYGLRRMFSVGILVFLLGSIGAALAPTLLVLNLSRVLQGIGSALLVPASLAILGSSFEGAARGRAIGTWAAAGAIAAAFGPPLGGWLTEHLSWRVIFAINIPLGLAGLVLARLTVPPIRQSRSVGLDWPGAMLVTLGLGALTWGLSALATGSLDEGPMGLLVASALLLGSFVWVEHARGDEAMVPLSMFRSPAFSGVNLLTLFLYAGLSGLLVLLPYLLIEVQGYGAAKAGAALLPLPLIIGVLSRPLGSLAARHDPRFALTAGPLIVAAGFLLFLSTGSRGAYALTILPGLAAIALGMAVTIATLTTTVMSAVPNDQAGTASGINNAVSRIGGLIAVALLGYVLVIDPSRPDIFVSHFHAAALIGACLCLAGAAVAWTMIKDR